MLVCPKCGDRYEESDRRDLCPRCLIGLEERDAAGQVIAAAAPDTGLCTIIWGVIAVVFVVLAVRQNLVLPPGLVRLAPIVAIGLWFALAVATQRALYRRTHASGTVGFFLFILAAWGSYKLLWDNDERWALLLVAGFWAAAALTTFKCINRSTILAASVSLPRSVGLGIDVPYRVAVTPARRLRVHRATLLLVAEERAQDAGSDGGTDATADSFRTEAEVCRDAVLAPNRETVFSGTFHMPEHAPPTFVGDRNTIQWSTRLWVGVTGWRPDAWQLLDRPTVLPIAPAKPERSVPSQPMEVPAPALEAFGGRVTLNAALDPRGRLRLRAGESVDGRLCLTRPAGCSRLLFEVRCHVTSSERSETPVNEVETLWNGDPDAVREIDVPLHIGIPRQGPITYRGDVFQIEWVARIRAKIPDWSVVAVVPIVVGPAAAAPP